MLAYRCGDSYYEHLQKKSECSFFSNNDLTDRQLKITINQEPFLVWLSSKTGKNIAAFFKLVLHPKILHMKAT